MAIKQPIFKFAPAQSSQRKLIHQWLEQKHIQEWMHGVGLQNTLNGLEKFFQGAGNTTYWIGYDLETPFAFLITSTEGKDAITLDLFICDLDYLGKGLAAAMIREFLVSQFSHVKRVLIDPEATNARAIHVYQKVGFKIVGKFIASWHPVPHYQMELYMQDLLKSKTQEKICLASDNYATVHPSVIDAILEANHGYAPSYGADPWTAKAEELIHRAFKAKPKVIIIPNGTGANVLALKLACKRHESVICTDMAHLQYQESGAAESVVGCKLLTVPHQNGKVTPEGVIKKLKSERAFGKHSTSPRLLSITQPTEVGTVYTLEELKALSKLCKEEGLLLHMDGSRLYNAAVSLKVPLDEIARAASLDLLSLGGTKNGLMCGESLLIFNPALQEGADHLHKQNLGLVSKMRYLSAQYIPFFKNELWHTLAMHANQKAQEIAAIIKATSNLSLSYPVETNHVFFTAPVSWTPLILERIHCYPWDQEKNEIRLVTSWSTTEKDVEGVRALFHKLSQHPR